MDDESESSTDYSPSFSTDRKPLLSSASPVHIPAPIGNTSASSAATPNPYAIIDEYFTPTPYSDDETPTPKPDQTTAETTDPSEVDPPTTPALAPDLEADPEEEEEEVVDCGCLALHPGVHWLPRYFIPLAILLDVALFVSSNTGKNFFENLLLKKEIFVLRSRTYQKRNRSQRERGSDGEQLHHAGQWTFRLYTCQHLH
jgi:hypothetical protein